MHVPGRMFVNSDAKISRMDNLKKHLLNEIYENTLRLQIVESILFLMKTISII